MQNRVRPIHLPALDHNLLWSWSVKNNLKVEYFCQKDLQRLTWQRELELFIQYFDWPLPVFIWVTVLLFIFSSILVMSKKISIKTHLNRCSHKWGKNLPTAEEETNTSGGDEASAILVARSRVVSIRLLLTTSWKSGVHLQQQSH